MGRKKKRKQQSSYSKIQAMLTSDEKILVGLDEAFRGRGPDSDAALSLAGWYRTHGYWTDRQLRYAKAIIANHRRKTAQKKPQKYYLYAISDGTYVKLGFSARPKERLKDCQTGCPKPLALEMTIPVGEDRRLAIRNERLLHRVCRDYRTNGEWFHKACLELVERFEPDDYVSRSGPTIKRKEKKRKGRVTNPAGIRHFYDGDAPPWDD